MQVIFGTTNRKKIEDLINEAKKLNIDLKVLSLSDIGWDLGEIEEDGSTIEENSLIKARAIYNFCRKKGLALPIITDDSGIFVDSLNGEPGVYTSRYACDEGEENTDERIYQGVIKLLDKLNGADNRDATYKCAVTCMLPNGTHFQTHGKSRGKIAEGIMGELKAPYFDSVFVLDRQDRSLNDLTSSELENSFRYIAFRSILVKLQERKREQEIER